MDELQTHSFQSIDQDLIVRGDEEATGVRGKWRSSGIRHEFSLVSRDRVEFLRAVGLSLNLDMPRRTILRSTPYAYEHALVTINAERQCHR